MGVLHEELSLSLLLLLLLVVYIYIYIYIIVIIITTTTTIIIIIIILTLSYYRITLGWLETGLAQIRITLNHRTIQINKFKITLANSNYLKPPYDTN